MGGPKGGTVKVAKRELVDADSGLSHAINRWLRIHGKSVPVKLTDEQRKNLEECFNLMDKDGSGQISGEELGSAFKLLGLKMDDREVQKLVHDMDVDGSGDLDYHEYLELMSKTLHSMEEGQAKGEEQDTGQVPFELMATAYRRKCLLEGLLNRDPDVAQQISHMSEKAAHEAIEKAAAAAESSKVSVAQLEAAEGEKRARELKRVQERRLKKIREGQAALARMPETERSITMALLAARKVAAEEAREPSRSDCSEETGERPWLADGGTGGSGHPLPEKAVQIAWQVMQPRREDFKKSAKHKQLLETPVAFGHEHLRSGSSRPASAHPRGAQPNERISRPWSAAQTMVRQPPIHPPRPFSSTTSSTSTSNFSPSISSPPASVPHGALTPASATARTSSASPSPTRPSSAVSRSVSATSAASAAASRTPPPPTAPWLNRPVSATSAPSSSASTSRPPPSWSNRPRSASNFSAAMAAAATTGGSARPFSAAAHSSSALRSTSLNVSAASLHQHRRQRPVSAYSGGSDPSLRPFFSGSGTAPSGVCGGMSTRRMTLEEASPSGVAGSGGSPPRVFTSSMPGFAPSGLSASRSSAASRPLSAYRSRSARQTNDFFGTMAVGCSINFSTRPQSGKAASHS